MSLPELPPLLKRTLFFVGYSTADIDIRRLLFESPALKTKCFFVCGLHLDSVAMYRLSRFGTVLSMDLDALVSALNQASSSYSAHDHTPINYCVRRFEPPNGSPPFEDRFIFDLFLYGYMKPEYVWQSLHGPLPYFVESPEVSRALSSFDSGHRAVTIYSDLGNGKGAVLEVLKARAFDNGYDVYSVVINSDTLLEELQALFRSSRKTLLVVEHYANWLETIDFIGKNVPKNFVLAFSARTSTHDVMVDRLAECLKPGTLVEIPVDRLQTKECEKIVDLFDHYGLWGTLAARSKLSKLRRLNTACHSEWHAILIDRFDAPQIRDRFAPVIDALSKRKRFYEVLMATLVLNVLEYTPSVDFLVDLCGQAVLEREFKDDPSIQELLDASSGRIRLRSSVAGRFILTRFADPNAVVSVLTKMAKASDNYARNSERHYDLLRSLTRFHNLQDIFPEKGRRKAIIHYYESIKDLEHTRRNPLFWLQYAIACTLFEDFDRAKTYFSTAYSLAEARGFNAFQIDNHYARFLLMRSIRSKDQGHCMNSFRDARKLIFEQIQTERRHYPFRVATHIAEFYDTFATVLSASDRQEIARAAKHIADRIDTLPKWLQGQRYIVECRSGMLHVLALVEAV
jgi:hypothetical protein